jgi:hypothetical protein
MAPTRCPETSVKDYHSTLYNIPEERRSHQHRDGSPKSRIEVSMVPNVQTESGAPPASYGICTRSAFLGDKAAGA